MKKAAVGAVMVLVGMAAFQARGAVIYVDADATLGADDGTSWTDAYTDLQSALTQPLVFGDEIWVAEGTYKPTGTADKGISFALVINIPVYGGFVGTESDRSQRDWVARVTILSGDINTPGDPSDNSSIVVTGATGARLDGVTVTGAYGSGGPTGRGMDNSSISGIVVANCTFVGNTGTEGSGMFCYACPDVTVTDCTFSGNTVTSRGGAAHASLCGSLTVTGCTFSGNQAFRGGGLYVANTTTTVSDCEFSLNTVIDWGGGVFADDSSPIDVANCTFSSNSSPNGAGISLSFVGSIENCVFLNNAAAGRGAGLYNEGSSVPITNCTFYGNNALGGGGAISNSGDSTVTNCILWGNSASEIENNVSIVVNHCNVQGGWGGAGTNNIDLDPLFVDAAGDDVHLLTGSPCIDTGDPATTLTEDIDGNPRPAGSGYDMGAYESQPITHTVSGNVTLTGALTDPSGVTIRLMSGGTEADSEVLSGASYLLGVPLGTYTVVLDMSSSPSLVFDVTSPSPNAIVVGGGAVVADVTAAVVDMGTTYTITPSVDAGNGTITPATPQTVFAGESVMFVITPDAGNMVGDVLVDGVSVGTVTFYEFIDVAADGTIAVTFESPPSDGGGCAPSAGRTGFGLALLWLGMLVFLKRRPGRALVRSGGS